MRTRIAWLCGFAAFVCILMGLFRIYVGESILPAPFNFTAKSLLSGAMICLLFGINWNLSKD